MKRNLTNLTELEFVQGFRVTLVKPWPWTCMEAGFALKRAIGYLLIEARTVCFVRSMIRSTIDARLMESASKSLNSSSGQKWWPKKQRDGLYIIGWAINKDCGKYINPTLPKIDTWRRQSRIILVSHKHLSDPKSLHCRLKTNKYSTRTHLGLQLEGLELSCYGFLIHHNN